MIDEFKQTLAWWKGVLKPAWSGTPRIGRDAASVVLSNLMGYSTTSDEVRRLDVDRLWMALDAYAETRDYQK